MDLSAEAVEIAQLALWIRSARPNRTLANLSANIVCGNSLVSDPEVHTRAMVWRDVFPEVFAAGGFDCVIGNPPWERAKVQEREFFARFDPATAQAVSAADRRKPSRRWRRATPTSSRPIRAPQPTPRRCSSTPDPPGDTLHRQGRHQSLHTVRGTGDRDRRAGGLVGLLTPSGIATDDSTKEFFSELMDRKGIRLLYDFENHKPWFPDVHRAFKFTAMVSGGVERSFETTDFVFYARAFEELAQRKRHIPLNAADLKLLNPNTRTCPIFRTRRDAELTRGVYRRVPVLIDHGREAGGNPWGLRFLRMFDQTNDAELFERGSAARRSVDIGLPATSPRASRCSSGVRSEDGAGVRPPGGGVVVEEGLGPPGQKEETVTFSTRTPSMSCCPVLGRRRGSGRFDEAAPAGLIGFKDITSPTNERHIASAAPLAGFTNHFVLLRSDAEPRGCSAFSPTNAMALDYITRQKSAASSQLLHREQLRCFRPMPTPTSARGRNGRR